MRVLKWTSVCYYIDGDTGEIITADNAKRNYVLIKKTKDYDFTVKTARDTKEQYKECTVTHFKWYTRKGSQQRLFND